MKYENHPHDMFVGVYERKVDKQRIRVVLTGPDALREERIAYEVNGRYDTMPIETLLNHFELLDNGCFNCEFCTKPSPKPLWGPGWITCPSCGKQARTPRERKDALAAETEEWRNEVFPDTPTKENILAQLKMLLDQVPGAEPWDQKGLELMSLRELMTLLFQVQRSMEESFKDGEVRGKVEAAE